MTKGTMMGATEVLAGQGVIATSRQGNFEAGIISLEFNSAAEMAQIERGGNYTLRDAAQNLYTVVCTGADMPIGPIFLMHFHYIR